MNQWEFLTKEQALTTLFPMIVVSIGLLSRVYKFKQLKSDPLTPLYLKQTFLMAIIITYTYLECNSRFLSVTNLFYWFVA